jgi:anti-sigma regulatory factor (Ser/Thr protein kinase)
VVEAVLFRFVCGVNICPVMNSRIRTLYKIDPQPEAPAHARRIIAEELSSRVPDETVDDIKLMVSELVTNGIVHGGQADVPVMLDLSVNGDIRCGVLDHGAGFSTRLNHPPSTREGGWGLRLVEQLSDRWGVECSPQRTEVWFERQCA